jgi:hypothetical protein
MFEKLEVYLQSIMERGFYLAAIGTFVGGITSGIVSGLLTYTLLDNKYSHYMHPLHRERNTIDRLN